LLKLTIEFFLVEITTFTVNRLELATINADYVNLGSGMHIDLMEKDIAIDPVNVSFFGAL